MAGAAVAVRAIDMFAHHGGHPRMGAADVIPFMPVRGVTMDECVSLARDFGRALAETLDVPVYLYDRAALSPERASLAEVRKGEFEGLRDAVARGERLPDFGPHAIGRAGATAVGRPQAARGVQRLPRRHRRGGGQGDRARRARVVGRPAGAPRDRVRRARTRRHRHRVDEPGGPRGDRAARGVRRRGGARRRPRPADHGERDRGPRARVGARARRRGVPSPPRVRPGPADPGAAAGRRGQRSEA